MQVIWLFGVGLIFTWAFVLCLWVFYLGKRNAGMLDVAWPVMFLVGLGVMLYYGSADRGYGVGVSIMVGLWAVRLFWHLWNRFKIDEEDKRYVEIRKSWGGDLSGFKFIGMFLLQGFLAMVISLPIFVVGAHGQGEISMLSWLGMGISLMGILGETVADYQMQEFKKKASNKGKICERGLWSRSRHPNYFFEWVVWVGVGLYALPLETGVVGLVGPSVIYYLLRYVSGVPMLEKAQLKSKKEAWQDYQKRVPEFFPHF